MFRIVHHHRFGHAELQRTLHDLAAREHLPYLVRHGLIDLQRHGQIEIDEKRVIRPRKFLLPRGTFLHRLIEDEMQRLRPQVGRSFPIHEPERIDEAMLGMIPPHQSLETGKFLRRHVDDRLVEHPDLVFLDGLSDLSIGNGAFVGLLPHLRAEDFDAVRSAPLRPVHRRFRFAQKVGLRGLMPVVDGKSERTGKDDLLSGKLYR